MFSGIRQFGYTMVSMSLLVKALVQRRWLSRTGARTVIRELQV